MNTLSSDGLVNYDSYASLGLRWFARWAPCSTYSNNRGRCFFFFDVERPLTNLSFRVCVCVPVPEFSSVFASAVVDCVQKK